MSKKLLEMATAGCILMMVGAIAPLGAQQIVVSKDNRTIAVTTSADASVDADTAIVHIGFAVYGPDQQTAYANGSRISNAVIRALVGGGVDREAIESENQGITPVQLYAGEELTSAEKAERKFQVVQSWTVKTGAKNASQVLDLAVKAGANQSGQIEWTIADEDGLEAKAAALAMTRAKRIAQQMAEGLNTSLGPLIYASNQPPSRSPEPLMSLAAPMAARKSPAEVAPLSVEARKVTRSATVYAVFAIQ